MPAHRVINAPQGLPLWHACQLAGTVHRVSRPLNLLSRSLLLPYIDIESVALQETNRVVEHREEWDTEVTSVKICLRSSLQMTAAHLSLV